MRSGLWRAVILAALTLAGCGRSESAPSGRGAAATEGGGAATVPDKAVVLESTQGTIAGGGGTVALADGIKIVAPAGAAESPVNVTLAKLDPAILQPEANHKLVLLDATSSVANFKSPVEVRIPLEAGDHPEDRDRFRAGIVDPKTHDVSAVPVEVEKTAGGKYELVVRTTHFCWFLFDWLLGATPPDSYGPIEVPIYKQGGSLYCWAMNFETILRSGGSGPISPRTIIGRTGISFEHAEPDVLYHNAKLDGLTREYIPKYLLKRYLWDFGALTVNTPMNGPLKRYIKERVALNVPVALATNRTKHIYVIVGYDDKGNFYVHDPQTNPDIVTGRPLELKKQGYYLVPDSAIGLDRAYPLSSFMTMYVPRQVVKDRPLVTLALPHQQVLFAEPGGDEWTQMEWDCTEYSGTSLRTTVAAGANSGKAATHVPSDFEALYIGDPVMATEGMMIVNASLTETKEVFVKLAVSRTGHDARVLVEEKTPFTIKPNSMQLFRAAIPGSKLRDEKSGKYDNMMLKVTVEEGGKVLDEDVLRFSIAPAVIKKVADVDINVAGKADVAWGDGHNEVGNARIEASVYEAKIEWPMKKEFVIKGKVDKPDVETYEFTITGTMNPDGVSAKGDLTYEGSFSSKESFFDGDIITTGGGKQKCTISNIEFKPPKTVRDGELSLVANIPAGSINLTHESFRNAVNRKGEAVGAYSWSKKGRPAEGATIVIRMWSGEKPGGGK